MLRALMNEPEILLMDEPTASIDPGAVERILNLVNQINKNEKMTILIVTHIPEHARKVAERGIVLIEGKKIADDNIENLINSIGSWDDLAKQEKSNRCEEKIENSLIPKDIMKIK